MGPTDESEAVIRAGYGAGMDLPEGVVIPAATIDREVAAAVAWLPQSDNPQFVRGAIAACTWIQGRLAHAPVSGVGGPVTLQAIRREESMADDAVYGAAGDPPVDRRFAVGAQNALLWLRGKDPAPPISIDG